MSSSCRLWKVLLSWYRFYKLYGVWYACACRINVFPLLFIYIWSVSEVWEQEDQRKIKIEYSGKKFRSRWKEESRNYQSMPILGNSVCQLISQACSDKISTSKKTSQYLSKQSIQMLRNTEICITNILLPCLCISLLTILVTLQIALHSYTVKWNGRKAKKFRIYILKCVTVRSVGSR